MIPASSTRVPPDHRRGASALGEGIGGADCVGRILPAAGLRHQSSFDPGARLVLGQRHADHPGRGDEHLVHAAAQSRAHLRLDRLDRLTPAPAGEGVGIARIDDQRPRAALLHRLAPQFDLGRGTGALGEDARDAGALGQLGKGQVAAVPRLVLRTRNAQRDARDGGQFREGASEGRAWISMASASRRGRRRRKSANQVDETRAIPYLCLR